MSCSIKISGVDQINSRRVLIKASPITFSLPIRGQRGTATIKLQTEASDGFTPSAGMPIEIDDNGTSVFTGTVDTVDQEPRGFGKGFYWTLNCVSEEQRLDKRTFTGVLQAGSTAGANVTALIGTTFADEGISLGTISAGITLASNIVWEDARLSDVISDLASRSGDYIWYIKNGTIYFTPNTTTAAPFSLDGTEILRKPSSGSAPKVSFSRADYRNVQHVKIAETNLTPTTETFQGDGVTQSFTVSQPIRELIAILYTSGTQAAVAGAFTGVPTDGDTFSWGPNQGQTYTFRNTPVGIWDVQIGMDATSSAQNLANAINGTGPASVPVETNLVFDGDSLTKGAGTGVLVGDAAIPADSYPGQTCALLGIASYNNIAVSGATTGDLLASHVAQADALYDKTKSNWYVLWVGFNNFNPTDAAQAKLDIVQIVRGRQAVGYKVAQLTYTPYSFAGSDPSYRTEFNEWVLSRASGADLIIDSGDDPRIADSTDLTYYRDDGIHMNATGYGVIASDVAPALAGVIGTAPGSTAWLSGAGAFKATTSGPQITFTSTYPGSFSLTITANSTAYAWDSSASTDGQDGAGSTPSFAEEGSVGSSNPEWTYEAGGTAVTQTAAQTPPAADIVVAITYKPVGFGIVTVQDQTEIAARKAIEGGSGIYENSVDRTDILTIADGITAAQDLLSSYASIAQTIVFRTLLFGLLPGQLLPISSTRLGISGSYLVQSVVGTWVELQNGAGKHFRYDVTLVSQAHALTAADFWTKVIGGTSIATAAANGSGGGTGLSTALGPRATAASDGFLISLGIDDDTVGANVATKYAAVMGDGVPIDGYITVVEHAPEGSDPTILDLAISTNKGQTFTSLYAANPSIRPTIPPLSPPGTEGGSVNPTIIPLTNFPPNTLKKGTIVRLDSLQGGGAKGIAMFIRGLPGGLSGNTSIGQGPIFAGVGP